MNPLCFWSICVENDFILNVWKRVKSFGSDHSHPQWGFLVCPFSYVMNRYTPWQERNFIIVIISSYCLAFLWRESVQQTSLWNHLVYLDRVIWTLTMKGTWEEDALWYFWLHLAVLTLQMNSSRMILRGGKKV